MGGLVGGLIGAKKPKMPTFTMPAAVAPPPSAAQTQGEAFQSPEATGDFLEQEKRRRKSASKLNSTSLLSDSKVSRTILGG